MKIKMIIWDLDKTLWDGVIAEGPVNLYEGRKTLIKNLNRRGIVNSVCSHNNPDLPEAKLEEVGLKEELVFRKYLWSSKGVEILNTIKQAQLRAENVLFIDDRKSNLEEAKFYIKDINVIDPHQLDFLEVMDRIIASGKDDSNLSRLKQYKILEEKVSEQNKYAEQDEFAFLVDSKITISITRTVLGEADRIYELLSRTNQLNYTKDRATKEEIIDIVLGDEYETYTIAAKDKFGFYGIIGFVAYNDVVKHFTFSCRILNMGVESFVFHHLSLPKFEYVGEVAYDIYDSKPYWIYKREKKLIEKTNIKEIDKGLIVGGCDLEQVVPYMKGNFDKHFNYVSMENRNLIIHRDSIDILLSDNLTKEDRTFIITTCPFVDRKAFNIPKFENYDLVIYSPLIDYIQGKYVSEKIYNFYMSCNPFLKDPLTTGVINNLKRTKGITEKEIEIFNSNWTYVEKPLNVYERQLIKLFSKCKRLVVLLAATNTYSDLDKDKIEKHKLYNELISKVAKEFGAYIVDVDRYIKSRNDFTNAIRHYKRHIYNNIAQEINRWI